GFQGARARQIAKRRLARSRQSWRAFATCYRTLTRLLKRIATGSWQGGGNQAATACKLGASNGSRQTHCRVEPRRGASCKHDCVPVAARSLLTASALFRRRSHGIALLLSRLFRFEARGIFQLRRKLCCFRFAHGDVVLAVCLRHCEEPTGPARSGQPDDRLRDEAIQGRTSDWVASLRSQ